VLDTYAHVINEWRVGRGGLDVEAEIRLARAKVAGKPPSTTKRSHRARSC
jgi:hypothetical protein